MLEIRWKSGIFLSRIGNLNSHCEPRSNIIPLESGRVPADFKIRVRRMFRMMEKIEVLISDMAITINVILSKSDGRKSELILMIKELTVDHNQS